MREIKFRAWNIVEEKMIYQTGALASLGRFMRVVFDYTTTKSHLMQYTGLKDKNGKEIYEGDLVAEIESMEELSSWGNPLVVEFGQFTSGEDSWGLTNSTQGFLLRYSDGSHTGIVADKKESYGFAASGLLVIGNIYEHPELLNKKL